MPVSPPEVNPPEDHYLVAREVNTFGFQRCHMDGIECSVLENSSQCTVSIKFTKDRAGCLAVREWTVEEALAFADETVRNSGHGCTSACGSWKRLTGT